MNTGTDLGIHFTARGRRARRDRVVLWRRSTPHVLLSFPSHALPNHAALHQGDDVVGRAGQTSRRVTRTKDQITVCRDEVSMDSFGQYNSGLTLLTNIR